MKNYKVQNAGIDKFSLIKFHKDLLSELIRTHNLSFEDQKLQEFTDFATDHSRTILFGLGELSDLDLSYKIAIYNSFDPSFEGLNEMIKKEAQTRSYKDFSRWLIERMKFAENFYLRAEPSGEVETKFLNLIDKLETFLQAEFAKSLLPLLVKIEDETRQELARIYNQDLSPEEKQSLAFEYLDKKEVESLALFQKEVEENLNGKALEIFLLVLALLALPKPGKEVLDTELKKAKFGYLSNIEAFFKNSFRRVKEVAFDNIYSQRDLKLDQLENMSFNRRDYKLSVLAHARAYFRGLLYQAAKDKTNEFMLVVPPSVEPSLNPQGLTKKYLRKVKTFEQWSKTEGVDNINVVNGLGLHHGSQEYYFPVIK